MLRQLHVENYRSLRNVYLNLEQLTVVTGVNGSGKSNLYNALRLLQASAAGQLSTALLAEGGMPSALWAGKRGKGHVRMKFTAVLDDLTLELAAGLMQSGLGTPFVLDPEIKDEYVYYGLKRTKKMTVVDRSKASATLTSSEGTQTMHAAVLNPAESILSQIGDPSLYPEISSLRNTFGGWRFYHQFDSSPSAKSRRPQPGVRVDALSPTGDDLGAAIATIAERGDMRALSESVGSAFPGYSVHLDIPSPGIFSVGMKAPGLNRPLTGSELSDGQLRFLCLATALLSTRPPELLVLNEPESSLHPGAVDALAPLILGASKFSQVWVTTHDYSLRDQLASHAKCVDLSIKNGETKVHDWPPEY